MFFVEARTLRMLRGMIELGIVLVFSRGVGYCTYHGLVVCCCYHCFLLRAIWTKSSVDFTLAAIVALLWWQLLYILRMDTVLPGLWYPYQAWYRMMCYFIKVLMYTILVPGMIVLHVRDMELFWWHGRLYHSISSGYIVSWKLYLGKLFNHTGTIRV